MEKEMIPNNQKEGGAREIEVNIAPLLNTLLHKLWLILLSAVIMALLFQIGTRIFIKPTYKASFTAFVNNTTLVSSDKSQISSNEMQAARELTQTYARILTSNAVLKKAAASKIINFDITASQIAKCVSTEILSGTQIIKVNVITTDPVKSYQIAQAIAAEAPAEMANIVKGSSMSTVDEPSKPTSPFGPNDFAASMVGALVGLALALAYVLIRYFRDDTIKGEGDLEGRYNLPVVGVIPNMNENKGFDYYQNYYYSYTQPKEGKDEKDKKNRKGDK